jgi:N-acetylneuraminic acid mutarotase
MKINILRNVILFASCLLMATFSACHPEDPPAPNGGGNGGGGNGGDNPTSVPTVIIESITSPTTNAATVNVSITNTGNGLIQERGIIYYTSESDSLITLRSDSNENQFSVTMENLNSDLMYFVKAYADNTLGTGYSEIIMFVPGRPVVEIEITEVTKTSISVKTKISNFSESTISEKGICYGQTDNLTYYNSETIPNEGSGNEFYTNLTDLTSGDRYYIRSYVKSNGEFFYSPIVDTLTLYPWHYVTDIPGLPRTQAVSFAIGSKAYIGTGVYQNDMYLEDMWEYDTETGTWTQKANYPEGKVRGLTAFSVNGKGYAGLGYRRNGTNEGEPMNTFYEYEPIGNTWTRIQDYPGPLNGNDNHDAFPLNNKVYIASAKEDESGVYLYEYDPNGNRWSKKSTYNIASFDVNASLVSAKAVGSNVYCYVRFTQGVFSNEVNTFLQYDTEFDIWIAKSCPIPINYSKMESFVMGDNLYLFSGRLYGWIPNYTVYKYYPETNTWTENEISEPKIFRHHPVNLVINGKLYYGGGDNEGNHTDLWVYDPSLE